MKKEKDKKWTNDEIEKTLNLLRSGKNFKEIGKLINRSHRSVMAKMNRCGYKFWDYNCFSVNKGKTKYGNFDWGEIKKDYENGMSQNDLEKKYKTSYQALKWGKENGKIKFRTSSDSIKLAIKQGKMPRCISQKSGIERYRQLCEFKFGVKTFYEYFNLKLIEDFGWYKAKNRGDNLNGVSRDHIYSINDGFINNINPILISHPANCKLMRHSENSKKNKYSSITLSELLCKIKEFENIYHTKNEIMILQEVKNIENGYNKFNILELNISTMNLKKEKKCRKIVKKKKELLLCTQCNIEFHKNGKTCPKCSQLNHRKVERPSYEVLLKEINETSYLAVGRKYGVSDNAIRKWMRIYEKNLT